MKQTSSEHLEAFFEKVKTISFIDRIFFWKDVRNLSYEAFDEYKKTDDRIHTLDEKIQKLEEANRELDKDIKREKDALKKTEREIVELKAKHEALNDKNLETEKELVHFKKMEKKNQEEYEKKVAELNQLKGQLDADRLRIQAERETEIKERFEAMKATWRTHEGHVEQEMREICRRHDIEYVDREKLPFKGKPDNTVKICDEYIVFDAKSPQGEDLENFPRYIRQQAEAAKKYAQEKDVKKEIFLVVPQNTLENLEEHFFNMADYNVYAISAESIEPIMLSLAKIEEYEFAEKLSPEDRDTICRTIAKFAHTTKRRIQIDSFFCNEFINILNNCSNLPQEILEKAVQYEKSDKLNAPVEKRAKLISAPELKKDVKQLKLRAKTQEIDTDADFSPLNSIPVERKESEE